MNARPMSRRQFVGTSVVVAMAGPRLFAGAGTAATDFRSRVRGLILGSCLGDALGGPVEFQEAAAVLRLVDPPRVWTDDDVLDARTIAATVARCARLRNRTRIGSRTPRLAR